MHEWQQLIREICDRGWTITIGPAHLAPGMTTGVVVSIAEYGPAEDAEPLTEIVPADDLLDESRDAILAAACRLVERID